MQTERIHLTKETLLATLYARAQKSRSQNPILHDEMAENLAPAPPLPLNSGL